MYARLKKIEDEITNDVIFCIKFYSSLNLFVLQLVDGLWPSKKVDFHKVHSPDGKLTISTHCLRPCYLEIFLKSSNELMEDDSRQTTWCYTGSEQVINTLSSENNSLVYNFYLKKKKKR